MELVNRCKFGGLGSLLVLALSACATTTVSPPQPAELQRAIGATHTPGVSTAEMMHMTPRMHAFVDRYVPDVAHSGIRMRELLRALVSVHGIEYDPDAHLTAAQVFEQRRANCLAFSSLVVAMSQSIGITTQFQEVDLPPTWMAADANLLLQFKHVNVLVDHGRWRYPQVVDFRLERYDESYPSRLIDEHQATARFYNNLGIEAMLAGRLDEALNYVASSLQLEPKLAFAWVNLGQIHRRMNNWDLAEISYRQALKIESSNASALNNLAGLYEHRGNLEQAEAFRDRANRSRHHDPYFRYAMAQRAYEQEAWPDAFAWVEKAIAKRPREHRFHHLLGMIHWRQGQRQQAIESIRRAVRHARQTSDLVRYEEQLQEWEEAPGTAAVNSVNS